MLNNYAVIYGIPNGEDYSEFFRDLKMAYWKAENMYRHLTPREKENRYLRISIIDDDFNEIEIIKEFL